MKLFSRLLFLVGISLQGYGQLQFDQFPSPFQLFPREQDNQGHIVIAGSLQAEEYTGISFILKKNGAPTVRKYISHQSHYTEFSTSLNLQAELSTYEVEAYLFNTPADSFLVKSASGLLCGDVYLVYGQSNSLGYSGLDTMYYSNSYRQYLRNMLPGSGLSFVSSAQWLPGAEPWGNIGVFGLLLGKKLIEKTQVPVLIINRAIGGASITTLMERNAANPADFNYPYGELVALADKTGARNRIAGIIWRQGENEATSSLNAPTYQSKLETLIQNFKTDFPDLKHIYIAQNNLLSLNFFEQNAGSLAREAQRRMFSLTDKISVISTCDILDDYDGLHYTYAGHNMFADRLASQTSANQNSFSPNIQQARYLNLQRDSVELVFQNGQQLSQELAKNGLSISHAFSFDLPQQITAVYTQNNRVLIKLAGANSANTITYLPSYTHTGTGPHGYRGPLIKNSRGIAALSFYQFPIDNYGLASVTGLRLKLENSHMKLDWDSYAAASGALKIRKYLNDVFQEEFSLSIVSTTFTDTSIQFFNNSSYTYEVFVSDQGLVSPIVSITETLCTPASPQKLSALHSCFTCESYFTGNVTLTGQALGNVAVFSNSVNLEPGFIASGNNTFTAKGYACL